MPHRARSSRPLALLLTIGVSIGASIGGTLAPSHAAADPSDAARPRELATKPTATPYAAADRHWPVAPAIAERVFTNGPLRVVEDEPVGRGTTGARILTLEVLDLDTRLRAKWKPVPLRLDAVNNSPRKELAAYELQKLFLDPADYVVPTSGARCLRQDEFADPRGHRAVTINGSDCRIGVLSLWLEDTAIPDRLLDPERFLRDPVYARHRADFNLATYLMKHQDGRRGNFLVARDAGRRRLYAIDNGVAFGGIFYNWFVPNWKQLRVPALRRQSVERLRRLTRSDLDRLGVVAQLEWRGRRSIRSVPPTRNLDPESGVRIADRVIQLGLDAREIESLWERIERLLEDVDQQRIPVF